MNQSITIGIAALLIGGAGGFVIGNGGSSEDETAGGSALQAAKIRRAESRSAGEDEAARRSRPGSMEEAMGAPSQLSRIQALMDMYATMDPDQLAIEAGKLDRLPMGDRIMASMLLFSRWAEVDPQGALAHAGTMGRTAGFVKPTILRSWASLDPVNAAKYYQENPGEFGGGGGRGRGDGEAGVIAREWAKLDPVAALDWANGLEGDDKRSAIRSTMSELASKDPAKAAEMASSLDPEDQGRAYSEIAEQWAAQDFGATEAWIQSLSGDAKEDALSSALGVLASTDPQMAADKLSLMQQGDERDDAVRDIASAWSRQNPTEAAEWLVSQDTEEMGDAMRRVMENWSGSDSEAALSFVESQPAGDARDSAAQAYLRTNRDGDPQESIALAETISDDETRSRSVAMSAMNWMRQDADAAKAYVEQSTDISDDFKQRLIEGGGRGDRGGQRGGPGGRGR